MKPIEEICCCIVDYGSFLGLAEMMGRVCRRTLYNSPTEEEYLDIKKCCIGKGFESFERCDEFMDPDVLKEIDLFIFTDIGFGGLQRYLRSIGKLVWGSMGASDLELYRTRFLKVLAEVGLPVIHSVKIVGVTALAEHLKHVEDKWIKVNRYRQNMETWHHQDYLHSQRDLERLASQFGGWKEQIIFVVQDAINGDDGEPVLEIGFDGWSVDGEFPVASYQGYEKKNQLYLGSLLEYEDLPEPVRFVNERMAPVLASYGYRNFWATEIRVKGKQAYYIDPTCRLAGQTMEHQFWNCKNLPQIILAGAQGELLKPEFEYQFAAEATVHYTAECDGGWKTFVRPQAIEERVSLYHCGFADGAYQYPPYKNDEIGVVCGGGDSVEEAVEDLKAHFEAMADEPVKIELAGFAELIEQIGEAEAEGLEFSDQPIPDPAIALQ